MSYQDTPAQLAVNPETAASLIDSTTASLNKDRCVGHLGIPYVKAGRKVVYRLADLEAWLKSHRITPQKYDSCGPSCNDSGGT
jgi:hypothetical protein